MEEEEDIEEEALKDKEQVEEDRGKDSNRKCACVLFTFCIYSKGK